MRVAGVIVVLACAVPAHATTLVAADTAELARDARAIAVGRVGTVEARFTEDRRAIETLVTLQVDTYLKGQLGPTLQFLVPGGQLGRFRHIVIGAPEFAVDDRVVVFLGARGPSLPYVLGLSQGLFRILREGSQWVVAPPLVGAGTRATQIVRGDPARKPMLRSEFEQRIRTLAGGAR